MQNARFLQIFRTFTPQEFKLFGKFLASPIYNSNKTLIRLYNYIKTFYPEFSGVCLKKEIVFSKLYSGKIYKEKLLRNLSSEMLYASEEYLVYLRSQKNSTEKKISLISELSDRSLHNLALSKHKLLSDSLNKTKYKSTELIKQLIALNLIEKDNMMYSKKNIERNTSVFESEFQLHSEYIILTCLILKAELNMRSRTDTPVKNTGLIDHIYSYITHNKQIVNETSGLYLQASKLTEMNNDEYESLKKSYLEKDLGANIEMKSLLRSVLLTQVHRNMLEKSQTFFYEESLLLMGPPEDHLFAGYLSEFIFTTYCVNYLTLKQFDNCYAFIRKYSKYLKEDIKPNVVNFNLSKYFLFCKEYTKSLEHSSKCNRANWWYYVNVLTTEIICYFELDRMESVLSINAKLEKYLKKCKVTRESTAHSNFSKAVKILASAKIKKELNTSSYELLLGSSIMSHSKWVKEKYDALKKATKRLPLNRT